MNIIMYVAIAIAAIFTALGLIWLWLHIYYICAGKPEEQRFTYDEREVIWYKYATAFGTPLYTTHKLKTGTWIILPSGADFVFAEIGYVAHTAMCKINESNEWNRRIGMEKADVKAAQLIKALQEANNEQSVITK